MYTPGLPDYVIVLTLTMLWCYVKKETAVKRNSTVLSFPYEGIRKCAFACTPDLYCQKQVTLHGDAHFTTYAAVFYKTSLQAPCTLNITLYHADETFATSLRPAAGNAGVSLLLNSEGPLSGHTYIVILKILTKSVPSSFVDEYFPSLFGTTETEDSVFKRKGTV